eukprot:symbB.v1.2.013929.t1/scaffold996.1/size145880/10
MRYSTMVHLLKELKQYGEEKGEEDWAARVKANQVQARALPQRARVEEVRMDPDFLRLTEKAWELRKSGDDCVGSDPAQAVRYYEWAFGTKTGCCTSLYLNLS